MCVVLFLCTFCIKNKIHTWMDQTIWIILLHKFLFISISEFLLKLYTNNKKKGISEFSFYLFLYQCWIMVFWNIIELLLQTDKRFYFFLEERTTIIYNIFYWYKLFESSSKSKALSFDWSGFQLMYRQLSSLHIMIKFWSLYTVWHLDQHPL